MALLMQVICPPLQVPAPLLTSTPPLKLFVCALLMINPPLAITSRLEPALPRIVAPDHAVNPETATVMFPSKPPAEKLNDAGEMIPLPLKTTVPPLMTMGPLVIKQLPLRAIVPLVKVLTPSMWNDPLFHIDGVNTFTSGTIALNGSCFITN